MNKRLKCMQNSFLAVTLTIFFHCEKVPMENIREKRGTGSFRKF